MLTCDMLAGDEVALRASAGALGTSFFFTQDDDTHASSGLARANSDCNAGEDSCTSSTVETSSIHDSISDASLAVAAAIDIPGPQLWLGNLAPEADDHGLELTLARFGHLEWVRVCPGKGFAIASFTSTLDAAAAKAALDGRNVASLTCGAPLVIHFWSQRHHHGEFAAGSFQGEDAFQRSPVDLNCQSESRVSIDGTDASPGHTIRTSCSGDGGTDSAAVNANKVSATKPSRHLWLGNLRNDAAPQDLETLFGVFGPLDSVRIFPSKPSNFAFVNFKLTENAAAAKIALEGHPVLCLTGAKPLLIRYQHQQRHPHWPLIRPAGPAAALKDARAQPVAAANADQVANNSAYSRRDVIAALLPSLSDLGLGGSEGSGAAASSGSDKGKAAPDEVPSRHLWLGNVLATAEKQTLERAFSPYGPLESIRLFPERNFGFVNFLLPEHAAAARSALRSKPHPDITGPRPLEIRFQHRPQIGPLPLVAMHSSMAQAHRQTRTTTQYHVDGAVVGNLMGLVDINNSGCNPGCDTIDGAGAPHAGCDGVDVGAGFNAMAASIPPDTNRPNRHLWLGNVPLNANQQEVELLFSRFGPLDSVRVFSDKNFAFVNFKSPQDAAAAKTALDGRPVLFLTGDTPLLVRYQRQTIDSVVAGSVDWTVAAADQGAMLSGLLQAASGGVGLQSEFAQPSVHSGRLPNGHSLSFSQDTASIGTWFDAVLQEESKVGALAADSRPRAISATSLATVDTRPTLMPSADLAFALTEASKASSNTSVCPSSMTLPPTSLFGEPLDYVTAFSTAGPIGGLGASAGIGAPLHRSPSVPESQSHPFAPFASAGQGLGMVSAHTSMLFGASGFHQQQPQRAPSLGLTAASGAASGLPGCFAPDASVVAQAQALLQAGPRISAGAGASQPAAASAGIPNQALGSLLYDGQDAAMCCVDPQAAFLDSLTAPMFQTAGQVVGPTADQELAALERIWTLLPPAVKVQWQVQAFGGADSRW